MADRRVGVARRVSRLRRLGALTIVVALAATGSGAAQRPEHTWTFTSGDRVDVYTTAGEDVARRTLEDVERVHEYFTHALKTTMIEGPRIRVIVFGTRDEFLPYAEHRGVSAFYQSSPDGDFLVLSPIKGDAMPVVAHEYAHLFFRRSGQHYPLWLSDGLAEYFSTIRPERDHLVVGAAPQDRARSLGFGVRLMPLERLFTITRESPEYTNAKQTDLFYAQSWALAHLLLTDAHYRDKAPAFFARLGRDEPAALAFNTVYGVSLDELGRDLTRYTLRGNYRTTPVAVDVTPSTAAAVTRPATEFEAGLALAALLGANTARDAQARAAFEGLEQQNGNDLHLMEATALFHVRHNDIAAARPYLDRAIAAQSRNARVFLYAAEARRLTTAGVAGAPTEADADEEGLIAKALSLGPDDVEVRLVVAQRRIAERRPADALALLAPLARVPLEYAKLVDDTRTLAQRLIKWPTTPSGHALPARRR